MTRILQSDDNHGTHQTKQNKSCLLQFQLRPENLKCEGDLFREPENGGFKAIPLTHLGAVHVSAAAILCGSLLSPMSMIHGDL